VRSLQHSSAVAIDRLNMRLAWLIAIASRQALNPNALHQFALADCSATSGGVPDRSISAPASPARQCIQADRFHQECVQRVRAADRA
jgi:hypothetical protein